MRRAFTLVELLMVIVVIGILIGLLIPAISGAINRTNDARVESQINLLALSLENFRGKYGNYPPSRVVFHESGYLGTPPTSGYYADFPHENPFPQIGGHSSGPVGQEYRAVVMKTLAAMRTLFPKVRFNDRAYTGGPYLGPQGSFYDVNGNGTYDDKPIYLEGHECLFLFLCGVPDWEQVGSAYALRGAGGFNVDVRNPFVAVPKTGPDASRTQPLYRVSIEQLSDDDEDGIPGILDGLAQGSESRYFAYFSSTFGGYNPNDVNLEPSSVGTFGGVSSPGPNPWTTGPTLNPRWVRPDTFQVLSAGRDHIYGEGGQITVKNGVKEVPPDRQEEEDNIGMR